jgi:hypothetical protein
MLPRTEYIAQSCYHRQLYAESLAISLEILAPESVDNREILDLALRCCLKVGDKQNGERLARGCRSKVSWPSLVDAVAVTVADLETHLVPQWITTMYLAHTCGMVLTMAGLYSGGSVRLSWSGLVCRSQLILSGLLDSIKALLCALSPRAIQYPHMRSLSACLAAWAASSTVSEPEREAIRRLQQDVTPATEALAHHFARPLFSDEKLTRREHALKLAGEETKLAEHVWLSPVELDAISKTLHLDAKAEGRIQNVWLKLAGLARASGGEQELDEEEDRGVRGL